MHAKNRFWRRLLAIMAALLLLLPGVWTALAWTALNLVVAIVAVTGNVLVLRFTPNLRWFSASIASLLIAVPPYPYWVFSDNVRGWHFTFFSGYRLNDVPFVDLSMVFVFAMLLFGLIFWALGKRMDQN